MINGVLLIDKPEARTSYDIIEEFKRLLGTKKIGHSGTLDRFASGLLVLCTGWATKLARFFIDSDKRYAGTIELGKSTDTCDVEGEIIFSGDASGLTAEDILNAAGRFKGEIIQIPPLYSAVKTAGVRASDMARKGMSPELKGKNVTIKRLDITSIDLDNSRFSIDVVCSKGTYIRAIARDIGEMLGTGAHLRSLRRLSSGIFNVEDALTIEEFVRYLGGEKINKNFYYNPEEALPFFGTIIIKESGKFKVLNGAPLKEEDISLAEQSADNPFRILDEDKNLIAIAEADINNWTINYLNVFSNK